MKYTVAAVVLFLACLFIRTTPPTIYLGDSGEITSAACTLGIGHPPGYPLYMMAAKIFSYMPYGDPAYRLNIFAVFLACAVFLALVSGMREFDIMLFRDKRGYIAAAASVTAALIFVFSRAFWFEGINAKGGIYMLTHFVIAVSIYSFLRFINSREKKFLRLALYSAGLMVPSHSSAGLFAAAIFMASMIYYARNRYKPAEFAGAVFLFCTGLFTPYLYIFIRAGSGPLVDWSGVATPAQALGHILRAQYNLQKTASYNMLALRLGHYAGQLMSNYNAALLFSAAGLYFLFSRSRIYFYSAAAFIVLNTVLLIYAIESSAGFLTNAYLNISLYASAGFYLVADILPVFLCAPGIYMAVTLAEKRLGISRFFSSAMIGFIPVMMILMNYEINDQSRKFFGYDHPRNIEKTLGPGDILFTQFDYPTFNIAYMKFLKGGFKGNVIYDRDAALLDRSIYLGRNVSDPAEQEAIEEKIILENPGRVYFTGFYATNDNNFYSEPYGILFRAKKTGSRDISGAWPEAVYSDRDYFNNKKLDLFYRDSIARYFIMDAAYAARKGGAAPAEKYITLAESLAPESDGVLTDISRIYYMELGDLAGTVRIMKKKVLLNKYDPGALNSLMAVYVKYNRREALDWVSSFYGTMPEGRFKEEVSSQITALRNSLENERGSH